MKHILKIFKHPVVWILGAIVFLITSLFVWDTAKKKKHSITLNL